MSDFWLGGKLNPVDEVFQWYRLHGNADYIGEPISQVEHMLQAALRAQRAGADDEVILASFFHDIGHLCAPEQSPQMAGLGVLDHERLGAEYLSQRGFSSKITQLVELHVQAKRYLCHQNPKYYRNLSEASKGTLHFQGGVMTDQEASEFRAHPLFVEVLRLRTWDEQAKVPNGEQLSLDDMQDRALQHITKQVG